MASDALDPYHPLSGFEPVDSPLSEISAIAIASAPRQAQFFEFTNAVSRS